MEASRHKRNSNYSGSLSLKFGLIFSSICLIASAYADGPSTESVMSLPVQNILNHFTVGYFGMLDGISLGNPSAYTTDANGLSTSSPVRFKNWMWAGYKTSPTSYVGAGIDVLYKPVMGHEVTMRDPYLKASEKQFIQAGNFNMSADLRAFIPTSDFSKKNKLLTGFQSFQNSNYDLPGSRWSLGSFSIIRVNFFKGMRDLNPDSMPATLKLYFGPYIAYKLSNSISFTLLYEMAALHRMGDPFWKFIPAGDTDLQPGVSWNVTPTFNVNPYFSLFPGGKINADSTTIGANISAKIL